MRDSKANVEMGDMLLDLLMDSLLIEPLGRKDDSGLGMRFEERLELV